MGQLFADAARAYLSAGINNTDTTISIAAGGALFPVANGTDWFKAVLQDSNGIEIVYVTAHTSGANTFTVTRGQEGTTARSFAAGSVFGIRVTAADMAVVVAGASASAFTSAALDGKVDKVAGKGLSTEDYTTAEKTKLAGVEAGAQVNTVNSVAGQTGVVVLAKADVGLANVDNTSDANKPLSTAAQTALNGKENTGTAAAAVAAHEAAGDPHPQYQVYLVSGTNIKTVNSTSILGSGDITISTNPSFTATASEALTTNNLVAVGISNAVEKVKQTIVIGAPTVLDTTWQPVTNARNFMQIVSDDANARCYAFFTNTNGYLCYMTGAVSSSTITWGTATTYNSVDCIIFGATLLPSNKVAVLWGGFSSGYIRTTVFSINPTTGALTYSSENTCAYANAIGLTITNKNTLAYSPTSNKLVAAFGSGSYSSAYAQIAVIPLNSSYDVTSSVVTQSYDSPNMNYRAVWALTYCSNIDRFVAAHNDGSGYLVAYIVDPNGTTNYKTSIAINDDSMNFNVGYSTVSGKTVFTYKKNDGTVCSKSATVTTTAITTNAEVTLFTPTVSPTKIDFTYNTGSDTFLCVYQPSTGTTSYARSYTINGTGFTVLPESTITMASTYGASGLYYINLSLGFAYANDIYSAGKFIQALSLFTNSSKFVGFSAGNFSSGSIATINKISGIQSGLSGLTAGTKYYVASDGTLTSTPTSVYAGIALSTTSILIKG